MSRSGRVITLSAFVAVIVVAAACGKAVGGGVFGNGVEYVHDAKHGVSCWVKDGISCLPDSQVKGVEIGWLVGECLRNEISVLQLFFVWSNFSTGGW